MYQKCLDKLTVVPRSPYQVDGIKWMISRECDEVISGGILADEVGLGKTLQSIGLVCANEVHNTLILVPKSLVDQWCGEFSKFAPSIKVFKYTSHNDYDELKEFIDSEESCVVISSISLIYNRCTKKSIFGDINIKTCLHNVKWSRLIIDEAHCIKNKKSKVHKACCLVSTNSKWLLSATPVMNKMTDFVNMMSFFGFSKNDCQTKKLEIVKKMIMRRTKEDVQEFDENLKLPDLKNEVHEVDFDTKDEENMYADIFEQMKKRLAKLAKSGQTNRAVEALELLLRVRQFCIHPQLYYDGLAKKLKCDTEKYTGNCTKLNKFQELVSKKPKQEKGLVFCHFIKELDIYQNSLENNGHKTLRIDGSMSLDERTRNVELFKSDEDIEFLCIQIHTGGQGYNLQNANWVYIVSPTWNPSTEHQAIGRAHRSGQQKVVNVIKIIVGGSNNDVSYIEKAILNLQDKKRKMIAEILDDPRIADEGVKCVRVAKAATEISMKEITGMFKVHKTSK